MAIDITLASLATRTTTTITKPQTQPYEGDTLEIGSTVDLGDNRACSVELVASSITNGNECGLEVFIETRADGEAEWRQVGRFERFDARPGSSVRQSLSFVADRYLRARWRIAQFYGAKGSVRFSVLARAVGGAS